MNDVYKGKSLRGCSGMFCRQYIQGFACFLATVVVFCCGGTSTTVDGKIEKQTMKEDDVNSDSSTKECLTAIDFAMNCVKQDRSYSDDYLLVRVERILTDPENWTLTFKQRWLIPENKDEIVGAGGEIFVNVNLRNRKCAIRYGE